MLKLLLLLCILKEILSLQTPKFSEDSKLTLVTTSCGRMDLLKRTYASYFKQNHYPLREIRIIDDCSTPEEEIMAALPVKAKEKEFVTIIVNEKHLGQFASIDRIYQDIKTKFVLHLEDDFLALPNNNIIQRGIEVLEWAEANEQKVSQISFARQLNYHFFRSELMTTPSNVGYFVKRGTPMKKYDFSLQPHILNYDVIYKTVLNSSIIKTIGPLCFDCLEQERLLNIRCVGCFQPKLGEYLGKHGWYGVVLDDDKDDGGWSHLGRFGEHVSMIKIESFWYYKLAIVLAFAIQILRLLIQIFRYPKNQKTLIKSEEIEQIQLK